MTLRPLQTSQSTFSPSFTLVFPQSKRGYDIWLETIDFQVITTLRSVFGSLWVVVLRLVPLLSWFDHGETVEMTLQYGKAEMEKRDLWPGLIRRCSWKCHSCTAKDSLIIIKTHMVSTVLHSVLFNFILLNYINAYLLAKAEWSRPEGTREPSLLTTILSSEMS